jgi:hypothetical protein
MAKEYDDRHGGPWDRGGADSYYQRGHRPHYFIADTYRSDQVFEKDMTEEEIEAYTAGYEDNEELGAYKDWG